MQCECDFESDRKCKCDGENKITKKRRVCEWLSCQGVVSLFDHNHHLNHYVIAEP